MEIKQAKRHLRASQANWFFLWRGPKPLTVRSIEDAQKALEELIGSPLFFDHGSKPPRDQIRSTQGTTPSLPSPQPRRSKHQAVRVQGAAASKT